MTNITFVDEDDKVIGYGSKDEAIEKGIIHRIVRVFVLNSKNELLIQRRSDKVKIPGRWDQSAAGHVDEGEVYLFAALREAEEEVGLRNINLEEIGRYFSTEIDDGITKYRRNVLYSTTYNGDIEIDQDDVSEAKWIRLDVLKEWMLSKPNEFTQGFLKSYSFYLDYKRR